MLTAVPDGPTTSNMKISFAKGAKISLSGAVVRTKKDKGYLAEMAFVTKAMSLGFNVCKPMGETPGFDFIVEGAIPQRPCPERSRGVESSRAVYKVQVKSGWGRVARRLSRQALGRAPQLPPRRDRLHRRLHHSRGRLVRNAGRSGRARTHGQLLPARRQQPRTPRDLPRRLASPRPPSTRNAQGTAFGESSSRWQVWERQKAQQARSRARSGCAEVRQELAAAPRPGGLGSAR
jgi:hypothetical protein